jgi:hypothetical protein
VRALTIFSMICRMELSSPPGVLMLMRTSAAPSRSALSIVRTMYSAVTGWMGASTVIFRIAADEKAGRAARRKMTNLARTLPSL